jgi:flagellar hook-length control protein FliK
VAPFAVALALGPDSSLRLTLDPVDLGRVEVAIDRSQGEAAIRVMAERPETLALLQRDSRELERALADAGFGSRAPTLSFSLSQGNLNQGGAQQGQSESGSRQASRGRAAGAAIQDPVRALPARRASAHPGLIDLAV